MTSKARSIIEQIRQRARDQEWKEKLFGPPPNYNEFDIPPAPLTADEWQEFKRKFVEEYGGEPVQPSGMTHSEFLHYIKTSGEREGDEYSKLKLSPEVRKILESFDD